jgi:hypothetical protein
MRGGKHNVGGWSVLVVKRAILKNNTLVFLVFHNRRFKCGDNSLRRTNVRIRDEGDRLAKTHLIEHILQALLR